MVPYQNYGYSIVRSTIAKVDTQSTVGGPEALKQSRRSPRLVGRGSLANMEAERQQYAGA